MQLTNKQIVESFPALQALGAKDLSVQPAFKIGRTLRKVFEAHQDYEKVRTALVTKHAAKDVEGNVEASAIPGSVTIVDITSFNAEHDELLAIPVEVNVAIMSLTDLGDVKVSPSTFAALSWMFPE